MHFRQKLMFTALGGALMFAGYLLATLVGDVTAQSETDKATVVGDVTEQSETDKATVVDKIVCRELEVVDADGRRAVWISTLGKFRQMYFYESDGKYDRRV